MLFLLSTTFPNGSDLNAFSDLISDFSIWIKRIGILVAFCGAIKFAIAIKDDDHREKTLGLLTFISGFLIVDVADASSANYLFSIPSTYTEATATIHFDRFLTFVAKWVRRIGAFTIFIGAVEFALSIKNNDANQKVSALKYIVSGAIVSALTVLIT